MQKLPGFENYYDKDSYNLVQNDKFEKLGESAQSYLNKERTEHLLNLIKKHHKMFWKLKFDKDEPEEEEKG